MESGFGYQWRMFGSVINIWVFCCSWSLTSEPAFNTSFTYRTSYILEILEYLSSRRGYHLTMALHNWQPVQQFRSLNSLRQSRICIHRLTTALPQESFYNIGIILLLLFCVCFPFMKRSDNETFRLSLADVFCVYILLLQIQASQIRHIKKVSPNKFRSIRNCLIHRCMMDNEISSINFNFLSLNARG